MSQPFPPKPDPYGMPPGQPPMGGPPGYQPMGGPPGYSPMGGPQFGGPPMPTKDECTMAMLAHLLGAFTSFVGPLVIWLMKKDESPFVNDQGKESLNFQLTLLIIQVVAMIGVMVSCGFLFFLPIIPAIIQIIFSILAAVEANKGIAYRYPMTLRMIS